MGAAAAAGWVWANAIGKFGKTAFAACYGRAFDSDAKRWRLRAALMWVVANGMEILTFVFQVCETPLRQYKTPMLLWSSRMRWI